MEAGPDAILTQKPDGGRALRASWGSGARLIPTNPAQQDGVRPAPRPAAAPARRDDARRAHAAAAHGHHAALLVAGEAAHGGGGAPAPAPRRGRRVDRVLPRPALRARRRWSASASRCWPASTPAIPSELSMLSAFPRFVEMERRARQPDPRDVDGAAPVGERARVRLLSRRAAGAGRTRWPRALQASDAASGWRARAIRAAGPRWEIESADGDSAHAPGR